MSGFNGCLALGQCQTMTSALRAFNHPVPAAAFLDLDDVAGVLAMEDRGIEAVENPSLLFVQGLCPGAARFPIFLQRGPTLSLVFLLSITYI